MESLNGNDDKDKTKFGVGFLFLLFNNGIKFAGQIW
jgi:hypothetical protein